MAKYIATSNTQNKADGFTHKYVVTYDDFSIANQGLIADSTAVTLTHAVNAGEVVTNIGYRLITSFDDSGGGSDLTVWAGDGSDPNGYLASVQIHLDGTDPATGWGIGAYVAAGGTRYNVDDTIDYIFTPDAGGTAYTVNELTQGEIHFYLRILDLNVRS